MKKIFLLIPLLFLLGGCVATNYSNEDLGASVLRVYQGGTGLSSVPVGECLKGNGTAALTSGACGTGTGGSSNWQELFTNAITPTSTTAGIFVKASSTIDAEFRVNATTTIGNNALVVRGGDGNVGVGTESPTDRLVVAGGIVSSSYASSGNSFSSNGNDVYIQTGTVSKNIYLRPNGFNGTTGQYIFSTTGFTSSGTGNSSIAGNLGIATTTPYAKLSVVSDDYNLPKFMVASSTGFSTPSLYVASNGRVGIGTNNPMTALQVTGSGDFSASVATPLITPRSTGADLIIKTTGAKDIIFVTNNTQEKMRLTSAGNVGIGTDNPNSKLEIYNSAGAGTITMSGNGSDAYNFDSMTMYDTGGKYWAIHHRNTDGGLNNLLFEHYNGSTYNGYMTINPDGHILAPNLRAASLNASSTLISTLNFTNATGTNLHLTELCLTNDCKTAWPTGGVASWDDLTNKPATSTILNLLDTQNRIAVLNATTTNIGTLKVYTALDFPANSITSAMMTTGWNSLHNATTTYPGFQSQFNTALNATTTWAGFTPAWNTLLNATTTWSAFDTNWNRKANATTTYPGFASQFATAYNATTTQTNFTPNWNAVFNATTTWAGFTSNFNTLLNATTTLDLSTFSVGSGDAFTINSSGVASSTNTTTIGSMKCYKSPNQESHTTTCISI